MFRFHCVQTDRCFTKYLTQLSVARVYNEYYLSNILSLIFQSLKQFFIFLASYRANNKESVFFLLSFALFSQKLFENIYLQTMLFLRTELSKRYKQKFILLSQFNLI